MDAVGRNPWCVRAYRDDYLGEYDMFHDWNCPTLQVHLMLGASNSISIIAYEGCSQNLSSFEEFDGKWIVSSISVCAKWLVKKLYTNAGLLFIFNAFGEECSWERERENVCASVQFVL